MKPEWASLAASVFVFIFIQSCHVTTGENGVITYTLVEFLIIELPNYFAGLSLSEASVLRTSLPIVTAL